MKSNCLIAYGALAGKYFRFLLLLVAIWFSLAGASDANSSDKTPKAPVTFTADEVTHNKELGIVKASGNVEVMQKDQILLADTISYNQKHDIVTASGNVSLLEPSGHVLFAEYFEISGDFKTGIIKGIKIRLSDNARIVATAGRRTNGNTTKMRNAVYSPCNTCADKAKGIPLWQVKAKKVTHDQSKKQLEYYDAWIEFAGLPVMYTPYFNHPDPSVKRQSGFLTPSIGATTALGTTYTTPYFYSISSSKDLTITPTITTNERLLLAGEYRQHLSNGRLEGRGSLTYDSTDKVRGHIDSNGNFDIDEKWRWGFSTKRSSHDTYLRRYGFPSPRTLTSRAFVEGFSRKNYLALDSYYFQGTAIEDERGKTPVILPMLQYSRIDDLGDAGANATLDISSVVMTRPDGHDTRRISIDNGWQLPRIGPFGDITKISANIRGDLYHVNDLERSNSVGAYDGFASRIYPQARADWRLPLSKRHGMISQLIEPSASFVISPYGGNSDKIPNEDSIDFEFDDTNLFSDNRFTGHDRVEGGPRLKYGLKWGVIGSKGGYTTVFAGQNYRLKEDNTFSPGSGLEGRLSDFVGRINVSPGEHINLVYRTRLDKDNFSPKRNEAEMLVGPPALRLNTNYIFFDAQSDTQFSGREELSTGVSAKLNRYWRSNFSSRYDMQGKGDIRNLGLNLTYECECFVFSTTINRQFYKDRDLRPNDTILFKISFKTLGDLKTDSDILTSN